LPAIVYVCGHSGKGRDGNKTAFQDHGFWFANNGYVCIVLDTLQLGEIPGVHHGTYGRPWLHLGKYEASQERKRLEKTLENRFWWHSIGYSPAAVECWNGVRAIDYLCTRDDVDPAKIGVTGISGGGAATFWIAAADERVKVAVPVSGMADLESYVKNKVINGHCDCMFLYNTYQWDWTTIAALVAPRPMLFANSDKDPIFPMDANRRVMAKLTKLYDMYPNDAHGRKAVGLLSEHVSPGGHDYRPDLRVAVFKFFNKHLKGDTTSKVEDSAKYTPLEGRKLRVFPEDKDLPKDALNARIDETFIPAAKVVLPEKGKFEEWKAKRLKALREGPFRALSGNSIPVLGGKLAGIPAKDGFESPLIWVQDKSRVVDWDDFANQFGFSVHLSLSYPDETQWSRKSPPNYVERSLVLLGQAEDRGKVAVISGFAQLMKNQKGNQGIRLGGRGPDGILAAYAALFEPSIKKVIVIDPPKSHKEGPHFLNVLRVLDIPEALGLLAPTPLTLIGGLDPAFDRTAEIYRLAGAADKLKRK
jgi:dienelactone hydrolase